MAVKNLKKLAKPLLRLMKRKALRQKPLIEIQENYSNASLEDMRNDRATQNANEDNLANEQIEQILYYELLQRHQQQQHHQQPDQQYKENLTYIVQHQQYQQQQQQQEQEQQQQQQQQIHIPVHFARTSKGTFFWTSMLDMTAATTTITYLNDIDVQHIAAAAPAPTPKDRWGQA